MKRLKKVLYLICIFLIVSSMFIVYAFANENEEYDTVAHHYFDKLEGKVPLNSHGSCAYVAISMLLSFYDIYWNDIFVSDKYITSNDAQILPYDALPSDAPGLVLENDHLSDLALENEGIYRNFIQTYSNVKCLFTYVSLVDGNRYEFWT